jgi:hypothetical protein
MSMRRAFTLIVMAAWLAVPVPGQAASDQDFELINGTGFEIDEVYVSASNNNSWGKDVLGQDVLAFRSSASIVFPKATTGCKWDLRVIYSDRDKSEWRGLNLCSISKVTLFYNRQNGTTRAVTE